MKGESLQDGLSSRKSVDVKSAAPSIGEKTQRPQKMEKSIGSSGKSKSGFKIC